jgi:hypothetical protein
MSKKQKFTVLIPDETYELFSDIEEVIDRLIEHYKFISEIDYKELKEGTVVERELDEITEEFGHISQDHGKLMQEYGVLNFSGNELYTRNTVTGIKLGLLMGKLERAQSIWGTQLSLNYDEAKKLIQHFADRYLLKKEES